MSGWHHVTPPTDVFLYLLSSVPSSRGRTFDRWCRDFCEKKGDLVYIEDFRRSHSNPPRPSRFLCTHTRMWAGSCVCVIGFCLLSRTEGPGRSNTLRKLVTSQRTHLCGSSTYDLVSPKSKGIFSPVPSFRSSSTNNTTR